MSFSIRKRMRPSHFSIQTYKNRLSRTQESTFHFDTLHIPLLKLYYNKNIMPISYKSIEANLFSKFLSK